MVYRSMNGIEKITDRIVSDIQKEIDEIESKARRQADEITAKYKAQADSDAKDILARGRVNADERIERLASVAELDAKKLTLAAKQEMLDKAFDVALGKLSALPEAQYVSLVATLAVNASRTGKEELLLSENDRKRCGDKILAEANKKLADAGRAAALSLSKKTSPIQGGLILSDGNIEINCTFETLVRLQRGVLAGEVAKVLFA